ncbi:MAG TPA: TRAP transporter substrate-binding protein [Alphaproteobacteria bacterium]
MMRILTGVAVGLALAVSANAQSVIKIGAPTIRDNNEVWMNTWKAEIEKGSGGRYRVDTYPASQLGSMPRAAEGVQLGTIEAYIIIAEFMGGMDKRFGVISAPGLFDDLMHGFRTYQDPEFKKAYWTLGEAKGVMLIGMYCPADTSYVLRTPITKGIADLRGKKIRAFPSPIEKETFAVFGASLAPMDLSEVIPALQAGVIDGSKSGMVVFAPFKYQGAAKNAIRSSETLICPPIIASKVWFDKLPGDMQKIVLDASKTADQKAMEFSIGFNERAYTDWKAGGGELYLLSKAERAEMMKMLEGVGPAALKGDAESLGMYELIKRVAARTRGKTG